MVTLAFVDVETVRLSSEHGSALWECAVILRGESGTDTEHLWQVRPSQPSFEFADAAALRISGYYERNRVAERAHGSGMVLAGPKVPAGKGVVRQAHLIAGDMASLLAGALMVGANTWFDAGHVDAFLREYGQALAADYHLQNIGSLVNGWLAGKGRTAGVRPLKLSEAATAMGIDPGKYAAHSALGDARLARDIWNAVFA